MIQMTPSIALGEDELEMRFIRSPGPGGQHVNTSATGVQLRFDVEGSPNLPDAVRRRLVRLAGNRMTGEGELVITATQHRSQKANREEALGRLVALVAEAEVVPKRRVRTRPSKASKARRQQQKRRRAELKKSRRSPRMD